MTTYTVAEVFHTLQGEGINAGRAAVFIRFAGCNLWSGSDSTRERDAERNQAKCPMFCDTDFRPRFRYSLAQLLDKVDSLKAAPIAVLTGGEPLLQVDQPLVTELKARGFAVCVETNGTVFPRQGVGLDHICVSPKVADDQIVLREGTELKVVVPAYSPADYSNLSRGFKHLFVSPEAELISLGKTLTTQSAEGRAARWCLDNPAWRLSLQTHKHLELP